MLSFLFFYHVLSFPYTDEIADIKAVYGVEKLYESSFKSQRICPFFGHFWTNFGYVSQIPHAREPFGVE